MPVEPGATSIFDLGYYDFGFFADLDAQGCRLVTRLKHALDPDRGKNTPVTIVAHNSVPASDSGVRFDEIVRWPGRLAASRSNPFSKNGRSIGVKLDTGRTITLSGNDLGSPADEIAELRKTRWQIELFFRIEPEDMLRWLQQNLRIRHFFGRSHNAVRLQIAAAMVTHLLPTLFRLDARTEKPARVVLRTLRTSIFHRVQLSDLVERIERPPSRWQVPAPDPQGVLAP